MTSKSSTVETKTTTSRKSTTKKVEVLSIYQKLHAIQQELKVQKIHNNNFGKFKYRSVEDIYVALKPLLLKYKCVINCSENPVTLEGKLINISKVTLCCIETNEKHVNQSFVPIDLNKKGMSSEQAAGSANSYCRKYALGGLFLIDDSKEIDSMDNTKVDNRDEMTDDHFAKSFNAIQTIKNLTKKSVQIDRLVAEYKLSDAQMNEIAKIHPDKTKGLSLIAQNQLNGH
tara:strand:+ start:465 stop:1151 length:687 start_codon:yes stop_codon:yes gene_type:complete